MAEGVGLEQQASSLGRHGPAGCRPLLHATARFREDGELEAGLLFSNPDDADDRSVKAKEGEGLDTP